MHSVADRVTLEEIPEICRDPNDDIATEDKDLLDMREYEGIRIVNGLELLAILRR